MEGMNTDIEMIHHEAHSTGGFAAAQGRPPRTTQLFHHQDAKKSMNHGDAENCYLATDGWDGLRYSMAPS